MSAPIQRHDRRPSNEFKYSRGIKRDKLHDISISIIMGFNANWVVMIDDNQGRQKALKRSNTSNRYANFFRRSCFPITLVLLLLGLLSYANYMIVKPISSHTLANLDNEHYSKQLLTLKEQRISQFHVARSHEHQKRGFWRKAGKVCHYLCQILQGLDPEPLNDDSVHLVIDLHGEPPDPPPISEILLTPDMINRFILSLSQVQTEENVEDFMAELRNVQMHRFEMYWAVVEWMMRNIAVWEDLTPMVRVLWSRVAQDVLHFIGQAHAFYFQEPFPDGHPPQTLFQELITSEVERTLTTWIRARYTHEDYVDDFIERMNIIRRQSADWYWAISEWILRISQRYGMEIVEPWARIPINEMADALLRDMITNLPTLVQVYLTHEQMPVSPTEIMGNPINVDPSSETALDVASQRDTIPPIVLSSVQIPAEDIMDQFNIEMTFAPIAGGGGRDGVHSATSNRGINALTFGELPITPLSSNSPSLDEVSKLRVKRDLTCVDDNNSGKSCHPLRVKSSHYRKSRHASVKKSAQRNHSRTKCNSASQCRRKGDNIEEEKLDALPSSSITFSNVATHEQASSLIDPDQSVAAVYSSLSELEDIDSHSADQHTKKASTELVNRGNSVTGQIPRRAGRFIR